MKKGEIYEGVVERIDFPNKGRVHVEGETVTVKNAIPGQKIRFQINKKRKNRLARSVLSFIAIRRGFSSSRGVGFESINYFTIFIIT